MITTDFPFQHNSQYAKKRKKKEKEKKKKKKVIHVTTRQSAFFAAILLMCNPAEQFSPGWRAFQADGPDYRVTQAMSVSFPLAQRTEGFPLIKSTLDRRVSWYEERVAASAECGDSASWRNLYRSVTSCSELFTLFFIPLVLMREAA